MKNVATPLAGRVGSTIVGLLLLVAIHIIGCGETEDPLELTSLAENTEVGVFVQEKYLDVAPGAPTAPTAPQGTPFVKAVKFFHDWQLTKPITAPVAVGSTIFIKVVFSEPMQHVVSDGEEARPILYYQHRTEQGATLARFKMADHGAKGEDFLPGDAKPLNSGTDDYICKYTVAPEDEGKRISLMVGRFSVDLEGNPLAAFYRHKVKLRVQKPAPVVEEMDEPETAPDVVPEPEVVQPEPIAEVVVPPERKMLYPEQEHPVTYGRSWMDESVIDSEILPPSAWVLNFPGPYREYMPPQSDHNDFVGRVVMPVRGADYDGVTKSGAWAPAGGFAPVSGAVVTITNGTRAGEQALTNEGGYFLFKNIAEDQLYLRTEKVYLEPKEVIVYRSRPTELQHVGANRVFAGHHTQEPGAIVMGLRWPDAMRFILENETLPHDVVLVHALRQPHHELEKVGGEYENMVITMFNPPETRGRLWYSTTAHELAHARQHAIAGSVRGWRNTSDAGAYNRAWKADLQQFSKNPFDGLFFDTSAQYENNLTENAAQYCTEYWRLQGGYNFYEAADPVQELRTRSPNRFKWAETHLNTRY